jgi:hypothetical protein
MVPRMVAETGLPVAVNPTGDPAKPGAAALSPLGPGVTPRVQLERLAVPFASVLIGVVGSMLPPPDVTSNVTGAP